MDWSDSRIFNALIILCVITHIVRTCYELLKYKGLIIPNKLSFVIVFINMLLLWLSWFLLCSHDISIVIFPGPIRYLGILLFGMGVLLFLTALFTIKTLESYEGDLIDYGIYSKIRHPMYLGFILWITGFPIFFGGLYSLMLAPLFIGNILYWRYLEEKELEKRFFSYKDYRKKTIF
jgi:protein-S-isoprenylcysteine O-methyltransferase Ste14